VRTRTKARQRAVEALFESEQRGVTVAEVLARNPEVNEYAIELATSAARNADRIDELVATYAKEWSIERMPAVDRAIARVAIAELLDKRDIDSGVIISEAVEIAQSLSTPESAKFLNGLLSNISSVRDSISSL
jgi:N utilization substance protein B